MQNLPKIEDKIIFLAYKIIRLIKSEMCCQSTEPSILQYRLMMMLTENNMSMSQIAKNFEMQMPTATLLVNRMCQAGYVDRIKDTKDQRKVIIRITDAGKTTVLAAKKSIMKKNSKYLEIFSENEKNNLYQLLEKLFQEINLKK